MRRQASAMEMALVPLRRSLVGRGRVLWTIRSAANRTPTSPSILCTPSSVCLSWSADLAALLRPPTVRRVSIGPSVAMRCPIARPMRSAAAMTTREAPSLSAPRAPCARAHSSVPVRPRRSAVPPSARHFRRAPRPFAACRWRTRRGIPTAVLSCRCVRSAGPDNPLRQDSCHPV